MIGQVLKDRYELKEVLGEGGMATVYLARDAESNQEVAVKVLKTTLPKTAQKRFVREYRAVTSINHPNCIKVYEFEEVQGVPFFTMEFFKGFPITSLSDQPLTHILSALYQAASALEYVHSRRIVHRDIKPSNLLVRVMNQNSEASATVELKLTDFGLARFYGVQSSLSADSGFVGTLEYCAPEQISNEAVDHRADLYALGLVAYQTLTRIYPFAKAREQGVQSLMRAQMSEYPAPCRTFTSIPPEIESVITRLLSKEPAARPRSAAALRRAIAPFIGVELDDSEGSCLVERETTDAQTRFIARVRELATAEDIMQKCLGPSTVESRRLSGRSMTSLLFITGEPGIGKSRLLREISRTAQLHGSTAYEGRCFEGNLAPYQPFVEIIRQMLTEFSADYSSELGRRRHPDSAGVMQPGNGILPGSERAAVAPTEELALSDSVALRGVLEDYSAELLRIAPDLRRWLPGEAFKQLDLSRETNYVLRAVANLFVEIAIIRPTCLFIEDLQWADPSSLDLLNHLASSIARGREMSAAGTGAFPRLFLSCTVRTDQIDEYMRELQSERHAQILHLQALAPDDVQELVAALLDCSLEQVSEAIVRELDERCQGNPFFVCESVNDWKSSEKIIKTDNEWCFSTLGSSVDLPETVRDTLRLRLRDVSDSSRQVLGICAVVGSRIEIELLRRTLTDLSENELLDALDELLARKVLIESGTKLRLEFAHDLLRELAYDELSGSRAQALHRRVGEVLEQQTSDGRNASPEVLASHFVAANSEEKALLYLVEAGDAALRSYAVDDAIRHLSRALDYLSESPDESLATKVNELLAMAYTASAKPVEAMRCHERSLHYATSAVMRGRILVRMGELRFRVGDFDATVELFDQALDEVAHKRPKSIVLSAISAITSFARSFWPHRFRIRRHLEGEARERAIVAHDAFGRMDYVWAQRSPIRCIQAEGRQFVLATRIGDPTCLAYAYARHALALGIYSVNRMALLQCRRALAYATQCGDSIVKAVADGHVGCAHYYGARLDEAERYLRSSLEILDRRGDSWFRMFFYHNLRHLYAIRGDTEKEISSAKVEMQIGETVRDPEGTCWGAYGVANALARTGRLDEAQEYIQRALGILSGSTNIVVVPTALQTYGFVLLQRGEYEAARDVLEQARTMTEKSLAYVDYSSRLYPLLVESILGPKWWDASHGLSLKDIRYSWRISRRAHFWSWRFPNYLPHALRTRGRAAWVRGKPDTAFNYFWRAVSTAQEIGAHYDLARTYIDLARVASNSPNELLSKGQNILTEIVATIPLAEQDKWD